MKLSSFLLTCLVITNTSAIFAEVSLQSALGNHDTVLGKVGEKEIRLGDIETKEINELRTKLYEAVMTSLQAESVKLLKEKDENYRQFDPGQVTDEDIKRFYHGNRLERRGTLEQFGPQIKTYLEEVLAAQMNNQLFTIGLEQGHLSSYLSAPEAYMVTIPVETAYLRGNKSATAMLMEFSDYQCPFCQKVQPTIRKLIEMYGDKAAFGYRHFPLDFHKEADDAAIAIECAREQDRFEQMHEALFSQQRNQHRAALKTLAEKVEVPDLDAFNKCLDSNRYADRVTRDTQVGQSVGITGTPGFIIGRYDPDTGMLTGEVISGAQPESVFLTTLEKYLSK